MSWEKGSVGYNNTLKHTQWQRKIKNCRIEIEGADTLMWGLLRGGGDWIDILYLKLQSFDAFPALRKTPDATKEREVVQEEEKYIMSVLASWKEL